MSHLTRTLPSQVEQGAVRHLDYSTEVVTTDGGNEVRNGRWSTPLRKFEVSFPTSRRTDSVYQTVVDLYRDSLGGLHSFNFKDWSTGETVRVRFDGSLSLTGLDRNLDHIETVDLIEVRS